MPPVLRSDLTVAASPRGRKEWLPWAAGAGAALAGAALAALFLHAPADTDRIAAALTISQKNRHFNPSELTLHAGDTMVIVNDDADLHHHAYVSSSTFKFDSGDQSPGSRTPIQFTTRGRFNVLCGIHPKMKLVVTVQ